MTIGAQVDRDVDLRILDMINQTEQDLTNILMPLTGIMPHTYLWKIGSNKPETAAQTTPNQDSKYRLPSINDVVWFGGERFRVEKIEVSEYDTLDARGGIPLAITMKPA